MRILSTLFHWLLTSLSVCWHHDWVFLLLLEMQQKRKMWSFHISACPKVWAHYCTLMCTLIWADKFSGEVIRASHCHCAAMLSAKCCCFCGVSLCKIWLMSYCDHCCVVGTRFDGSLVLTTMIHLLLKDW